MEFVGGIEPYSIHPVIVKAEERNNKDFVLNAESEDAMNEAEIEEKNKIWNEYGHIDRELRQLQAEFKDLNKEGLKELIDDVFKIIINNVKDNS